MKKQMKTVAALMMATAAVAAPEPWAVHRTENNELISVIDGNSWQICEVNYNGVEQQEANAARIVACVNACAGFYYPEELIRWMKSIKVNVESDTIDVSVILKELEETKRQRDELLKELEKLKSKL